MHDMFFSEEQYREYQDELLGDGYSNEFQRVYAQSRMRTTIPNERDYAARLHAQGLYVVCSEYEVCCPYTDGLLGYAFVVERSFDTREAAEAYIGVDPEDRPEGIFLYSPPPAPAPAPAAVEDDDDDEIPF
jgi:hypothetical protein